MKALVMERYKEFVYRQVPTPEPGPGEVRIRVRACSVCGSDIHGMDGSTGRRQPPLIMGHEAAGDIDSCGPGVTRYKPGDRVTFDSTVYCNTCKACQAGNVNLCASRRVLGVSCDDYRMDGAFAEYVVVPEYILYPLPDNVTYLQASMVEPLSVAYHAVTRAPVPRGTALVVGVGTIGLLLLQVLASMGVSDIIAADIDPAKLEAARKAGASLTVNTGEPDALRQILQHTGGGGVGAAYDATGIADTAGLCLQSVQLNGNVILVGNLAREIPFPLQWVVTRQLSLFGSCASAGEYDKCLELIACGAVDVEAMISQAVPLSQGAEWLLRAYHREPGLNKLVLLP